MQYRPKPRYYVAVALLTLAAAVYFSHPLPVDMKKWKPVAVPIQFRVGRVQIPEFIARLDTTFHLLVESEKRIEFKRLECLLGMADWEAGSTCANAVEVIDIDWSVLHDGRVEAAGSSKSSSGGFYRRDTLAREIGYFAVKKGFRYAVVLDMKRNGPELDQTNPRLLVQTHPGEWKDEGIGFAVTSFLRSTAILILVMASLLTLALTPLLGWFHRRYYAHETSLPSSRPSLKREQS